MSAQNRRLTVEQLAEIQTLQDVLRVNPKEIRNWIFVRVLLVSLKMNEGTAIAQ